MLPESGRFFFLMPYMLSGEAVSPERTGLYVLDGGNGGPTGRIQTGSVHVGAEGWSAAEAGCGVYWSSDGTENAFTSSAIRAVSPNGRWDVQIDPFITDRADPVDDLRRFELEERLILRRVPFIHRVPVMKGYASGVIEWAGEEHRFERALVYQAKNHGPTLPERWTWIHANAFAEDDTLTFEIAANPTPGGTAAMVRIIRPGDHVSLTTWERATVELAREGDRYTFSAASADGSVQVSGEATHGDSAVFTVPSPEDDFFEIDEDLTGRLTVEINGQTYTTEMAAVGIAHRKAQP